jgi:hypothetical protein
MPTLLAAALGLAITSIAAAVGGLAGFLYLVFWIAATLPGLPLGFWLFGRRHAAGWVSGALFGYVITALSIWMAIAAGFPSVAPMFLVWALVTSALWYIVSRRTGPLVTLPAWGRGDMIALLAFLWLVPVLAGPAFVKVGSIDSAGNRLYRAYFTADFLWHTALTTEVARFNMPPMNPYLAREPLHYYWTYFLPPAAVAGHMTKSGHTVEQFLLVNALCGGLLFFGMVFLATWAVVPRALAALTASTLAATAASGEGAYSLWKLWQRHRPFAGVRFQNIDALVSWSFQGLRIDGLPRSLWYVPQHAMGVAFGLIAMIILGAEDGPGIVPIVLGGLALGAAVIVSPMIGAAFSVVYGLGALLGALRRPRTLPMELLRHSLAAVPVALALGWCVANHVLEGTSGALEFGYKGIARDHPIVSLALSLGPLLAGAVAGLTVAVYHRSRPQLVALAGVIIGFACMYLLSMPLDLAYIGFRAGQVLQVTLPMLAAGYFALAAKGGWRRLVIVASALVMLAWGLPTTVIDAYNTQDTDNRAMGPGFHWTVAVSPEEETALRWIEQNTPSTALVQEDPLVSGRESWTMIPSLGQRRMAVGLPISLLHRPEYDTGSWLVHELFTTTSVDRACEIATDLSIDYVYLDDVERSAMPVSALRKFDQGLGCFRPAFRNPHVSVFAVTPSLVRRP